MTEPTERTEVAGEVLNHVMLWKIVERQRAHADANPQVALWFRLPALLFARLTVEAYANFLLDVLDPAAFAKEREIFGSSTRQKLDRICKLIGAELKPGERPYQSISQLDELRDLVVHAKPETYAHVIVRPASDHPPDVRPGKIETAVGALYPRAVDDVKAFCDWLHAQVLSHDGAYAQERLRLGSSALDGTRQWQTRSTTLATPSPTGEDSTP